MANDAPRSIAADLGEQYAKLYQPMIVGDTKATSPFVVLPGGQTVASLKHLVDENLEKPRRRTGIAQLKDIDSFIDHVNRFKSNESAVFANPARQQPSLVAVFDYYPSGDDATKADWMKHRASYAPDLSDQWKAWTAQNGQFMTQGQFAAFVEDRVQDLIVPNLDDPSLKTFADLVEGSWAKPTDMVALSRGLQINIKSTVRNAQTLATGETVFTFDEVHQDGTGQPLKVANLFQICIPVFFNGGLYRLPAHLRYRVVDGSIKWSYQLVRPELAFDDAFKGIVERVKKDTGAPTFLGSPEA